LDHPPPRNKISLDRIAFAFNPIKKHRDEIVEFYMDTALARADDKLVAMSRLAKQALNDTEDIYHAGLWRKAFAGNLLWYLVSS